MRLSVIIPVHNGGEGFRRALAALATSRRRPDELIVVDDASSDGSGALAEGAGARLLTLRGPCGPAVARNRGAAMATGDVLVFLDADVAVHEETLEILERRLREQPDLAAVFGSYDADPPEKNWASLYQNLRHHYVHQHSGREAATFWAGCGAIRHSVFAAAGGFSPGYTRPEVEDIELGLRVGRAGRRIWLCPEVQVTHLKRWSLVAMWRSDIFRRAVPWTRLVLRDGRVPDDLNLGWSSRLSALAAWSGVGCVLGAVWWRPASWGALGAGFLIAGLNLGLFRLFWRARGPWFTGAAFGLHALYFLYSSAVFALLAGTRVLPWARRVLPVPLGKKTR